MTGAERGILLLCCGLGNQGPRPLTGPQFQELSRRVRSFGRGNANPDRNLERSDLRRLGYPEQECDRILALLGRDAQLERYLAAGEGLRPLTCRSEGFPAPLLEKPGGGVPPVLFCAGNLALLRGPFVGLAGSRRLKEPGAVFAARAGELAAREGYVLVTGGAAGADRTAIEACLAAGGSTVVLVPDQLTLRTGAAGERCLLISAGGYDLPFTTPRAYARNVWVHKMGERTLIAQTGYRRGGTWQGATENLRHGWSEIYVNDDKSEGAAALADMGAIPISELESISGLHPLQATYSDFN